MDITLSIVGLLGGLGALLIAFKLLSDNIEKLANAGLKKLFNKTSKNRFVGVGIGALVTAIIQSSGATTVMIVGFVNAGIMDLFQATAMIMGANIGTTITAQIVSLQSIGDISAFAMLLAFIGMFVYMLSKKDMQKTFGLALAGLGLVFISLNFMSSSMKAFQEMDAVKNFLASCNNPFVLLLIGIVFTALIQSSSATTSLLISMAAAGMTIGGTTPNNAMLFIILGSNIGSCVTAILSSFGANTNAKRAAVIHLLFNTFGALICFIVLYFWRDFMALTFGKWFSGNIPSQIAMFHTFFNVFFTILFIPFINLFVKLATLIVPDKKDDEVVTYLDDRFLKTPSIAIQQTAKEILHLGKTAMKTLNIAIDGFINHDGEIGEKIAERNKKLDILNQTILEYMVKISSVGLASSDEKYLSILQHNINDFYRVAEIADNMVKYTNKLLKNDLEFSQAVYDEITELKEMLNEQFNNISEMYLTKDLKLLPKVEALEDKIDKLRSKMINDHIVRLERGDCRPSSSGVFINLVSNLERAGDHLDYIAHSYKEEIQFVISY